MFKHQGLQMFVSNETNISNLYSLEVVDRGSEIQLEVGENLNAIT